VNLHEALGIRAVEVVSITGGGGKTTVLYRMALETVAAGGKAIVTGTTRFTPPESGPLPATVLDERPDDLLGQVRAALESEDLVVAGSGWGNQGRILPVEPGLLEQLGRIDGVAIVVAEADGSAGRPFKAPAEHEPVVAPSTTILLTVMGIDSLGRPLTAEFVHRPEIVAALAGVEPGSPVDAELVARVLLDDRGGRKGLPGGARWVPVINKVDTADRLEAARRIASLLCAGGCERVLITAAAADPPVLEVVEGRP
jgi:probable selenium-dependent hydroxylase accessory protein YqeC